VPVVPVETRVGSEQTSERNLGGRSSKRRTQAERRASTRARLLDATIECLFELGYTGTTTTQIANRAGVSRGAQLHHFPTKADLVTAAVEHLLDWRIEEFRAAFAALPAEADRPVQAIDLLWSMFSGPTFYAWLELAVAARTDPALRAQVVTVSQRFTENVERTFRELFAATEAPTRLYDVAPWMAFAVMEGLALVNILNEDSRQIDAVLETLKLLAHLAVPPRAP